jgi:hypothetical protein
MTSPPIEAPISEETKAFLAGPLGNAGRVAGRSVRAVPPFTAFTESKTVYQRRR